MDFLPSIDGLKEMGVLVETSLASILYTPLRFPLSFSSLYFLNISLVRIFQPV